MKNNLLNTAAEMTLQQLAEKCQIEEPQIITYVEEGILTVEGNTPTEWRFSELSVVHIEKAKRLERDLGINPAGAALAFELLSEIDDMKQELKLLKKSMDE